MLTPRRKRTHTPSARIVEAVFSSTAERFEEYIVSMWVLSILRYLDKLLESMVYADAD